MVVCVVVSSALWLNICLYVLLESVQDESPFENRWLNPFVFGASVHSIILQLGMSMVSGTLTHVTRFSFVGCLRKRCLRRRYTTSVRLNVKDRLHTMVAVGQRLSVVRRLTSKRNIRPWPGRHGLPDHHEIVRSVESLGSFDAHLIHSVRD
jgi:hypothetical protein